MEPGPEAERWVEAPPGRCLFLAARALLSLGTCAPSDAPTSRGCRRVPCQVVGRIEGAESLGRVSGGRAGAAWWGSESRFPGRIRRAARPRPRPAPAPGAPSPHLFVVDEDSWAPFSSRVTVLCVHGCCGAEMPQTCFGLAPMFLDPLPAGPSHRAARGTAPGQGSWRAPTAAAQGPPCNVAAIARL